MLWSAANKYNTFNQIGVRGGARTGYVIPGRDGMGAWTWPGILPPSPSPSPPPPSSPSVPKMVFLEESQILSILTHMGAMDARLPGNGSELRQNYFSF